MVCCISKDVEFSTEAQPEVREEQLRAPIAATDGNDGQEPQAQENVGGLRVHETPDLPAPVQAEGTNEFHSLDRNESSSTAGIIFCIIIFLYFNLLQT
jgi:hypothetical protein